MDPEVSNRIEKADWDNLFPQLLLYTTILLQRNLNTSGDPIYNGIDSKSLIDQAIDKTLDGTRRWDYTKIDLKIHLEGTIRSDVSNLFKKYDASMFISTIATEDGPMDVFDSIPDKAPMPDSLIAIREVQKIQSAHLKAFAEWIDNDRELTELLEAYREGFTLPREIAELTGLDPDRIHELKRKLLVKYLRFTSRKANALNRPDLVRRSK